MVDETGCVLAFSDDLAYWAVDELYMTTERRQFITLMTVRPQHDRRRAVLGAVLHAALPVA